MVLGRGNYRTTLEVVKKSDRPDLMEYLEGFVQ
jgi:hypothetical protein